MSKERKIAAFTMVDILTGMVITSIIISMVFYLFTSLNKQVAVYGETRSKLTSFLLLNVDLKRQMNRETTVKGIPGGFKIISDKEEILYLKEDEYLIRSLGTQRDTLSSNIEAFDLLFVPANDGRMKDDILAIDLKIDISGQLLDAHFYKDYGLIEDINNKLLREF